MSLIHLPFHLPQRRPGGSIEAVMKRVSLAVSLVSLALMTYGFIDLLIQGGSLGLPGEHILSLRKLMRPTTEPVSLTAMSSGILLLSSVPIVRVLLALGVYLRWRDLLNGLVALIVLLELLLSIHIGT